MPAVLEGEGEAVRHARLLQEPPRLRARRVDVAAVAGELLQLRGRGRVRGPGHLDPAHVLDERDLGERLRGLVAVEGEREGPPHPLVVEGLLLVVHRDEVQAVPRALLHRDLVAQRLDEAVALGRAEAAELDVGPLAADRGHLRRRRAHEHRAIAVEIRLALVPVVGVLLADPVRALHVLDEHEGAGPHDVLLVPAACPWRGCRPCRSSSTARPGSAGRTTPGTSAGSGPCGRPGPPPPRPSGRRSLRSDLTPAGGKMILS